MLYHNIHRLIEVISAISPGEARARKQQRDRDRYHKTPLSTEKKAKRRINTQNWRANMAPEHKQNMLKQERDKYHGKSPVEKATIRRQDAQYKADRYKALTPEQRSAHLKQRRSNYENMVPAKKSALLKRIQDRWKKTTKIQRKAIWQTRKTAKQNQPETIEKSAIKPAKQRNIHWQIPSTGDGDNRHYLLQEHTAKDGKNTWGFPRVKADTELAKTGQYKSGNNTHHYHFNKIEHDDQLKHLDDTKLYDWATRSQINKMDNLHPATKNYFKVVKPTKSTHRKFNYGNN